MEPPLAKSFGYRSDTILLQQAQKLESIGRLVGGVAHDFNNMLGVILGRTEVMLLETQPGDPNYTNLKEIHAATIRY